MSDQVWIMGQIKSEEEYHEWEFMGVFTTRLKAIVACTTELHFIAPAILNERQPDETHDWEGCYYPLRSWENDKEGNPV